MGEQFWVGEYRADYSPLTEEQIAASSPELEELYRNSAPHHLFELVETFDGEYIWQKLDFGYLP